MPTSDGPDLSIFDIVTWVWRRADDELRAAVGPPLDPETDEPREPRRVRLGVDVGRGRAVAEGWLYARTGLTPSTLAEYFGPLAHGQVPAADVVERVAPVLADLDTAANRRSLRGHLEAAAPGLADEMAKAVATAPPKSVLRRREQWVAEAMILVRDHPTWSEAGVAREVSVSPSTLSRCAEYKAAARLARGDRRDLPAGHVITDPDTGVRIDVEAHCRNAERNG